MALKSSAVHTESSAVKKTVIFEVPNFIHEAKLLENSEIGRRVRSQRYEFNIGNFEFYGYINIDFQGGNLEFSCEINPGRYSRAVYRSWKTDYLSNDIECIIDAKIHCEGFQYKCREEGKLYGSVKEGKLHRFSRILPFSELKNAVPDHLENLVCLTITSTLNLFEQRSGSEWVEVEVDTAGNTLQTIPSGTAPFLRHLLDGKFSDFVIECDGMEFPVHRFVLKSTSPVFAAMLETDMKEAASGRIKLEDVGSASVERMIGFIYTGNLSSDKAKKNEFSDDLITELLYCAEKYEIPEMKPELLVRMQAKLSVQNAVKFLNVAELCKAGDNVTEEVLDFCKKNLVMLPKGPELQEFVAKYLKDLF